MNPPQRTHQTAGSLDWGKRCGYQWCGALWCSEISVWSTCPICNQHDPCVWSQTNVLMMESCIANCTRTLDRFSRRRSTPINESQATLCSSITSFLTRYCLHQLTKVSHWWKICSSSAWLVNFSGLNFGYTWLHFIWGKFLVGWHILPARIGPFFVGNNRRMILTAQPKKRIGWLNND